MPGQPGRLVTVSTRLPDLEARVSREGDRPEGAGGLVSALIAALEARGGLWFGWSRRVTDGGAVTAPRLSTVGSLQLAALDLTRSEASLFYNDFCNRTLWPLLHSFPGKMTIRNRAYRAYLRVNRRYAEALAPILQDGDTIWVHDFHLIPLAYELRRLGWDSPIGFFLHTPFPPMEVFGALPWASRLLGMLLDYDLIGMHTRRYANNLMDSLSAEVPGALLGNSFTYGAQSVRVGVHPVGIDPGYFAGLARRPDDSPTSEFLRRTSARTMMVLGVDRLDYTKGVVQRLLTYEHLLEHYPGLRGKVTMIQISDPSRTRVPEYVKERQDVDQVVGRINGRFTEAGWVPLRYLYRSHPQAELVAFYREAHVGLVTPLRDGMNLVAKEFVASQVANPGVVVLSKFCGAADTMKEALIVNPYDIEGTAAAIMQGLRMPKRERERRWKALMQGISTNTAEAWCDSFLSDLARTTRGGASETKALYG